MQNEKTLIELGFKDIETDGDYRLDYKGLVFRAHVWNEKQGYKNEHQFVTLGLIVKDNKIVDTWRDCCSTWSVKRNIEKIWNEKQ
jgi:hypothetical protein